MTTDTIGSPSPDAEPVEVPGWREDRKAGIHRLSPHSCPKVWHCVPLTLPRGLVEDLRSASGE